MLSQLYQIWNNIEFYYFKEKLSENVFDLSLNNLIDIIGRSKTALHLAQTVSVRKKRGNSVLIIGNSDPVLEVCIPDSIHRAWEQQE